MTQIGSANLNILLNRSSNPIYNGSNQVKWIKWFSIVIHGSIRIKKKKGKNIHGCTRRKKEKRREAKQMGRQLPQSTKPSSRARHHIAGARMGLAQRYASTQACQVTDRRSESSYERDKGVLNHSLHLHRS